MNIPLREQVTALLAALGVPDAGGDPLLDFIIGACEQSTKNAINQSSIPQGLATVFAYNAAGQYISLKKNAGQLIGFHLEEGGIKQLQEGDTSVTFALGDGNMTPEQRLESLIAGLTGYGASELNRYRRLKW